MFLVEHFVDRFWEIFTIVNALVHFSLSSMQFQSASQCCIYPFRICQVPWKKCPSLLRQIVFIYFITNRCLYPTIRLSSLNAWKNCKDKEKWRRRREEEPFVISYIFDWRKKPNRMLAICPIIWPAFPILVLKNPSFKCQAISPRFKRSMHSPSSSFNSSNCCSQMPIRTEAAMAWEKAKRSHWGLTLPLSNGELERWSWSWAKSKWWFWFRKIVLSLAFDLSLVK